MRRKTSLSIFFDTQSPFNEVSVSALGGVPGTGSANTTPKDVIDWIVGKIKDLIASLPDLPDGGGGGTGGEEDDGKVTCTEGGA